MKRTTPKIIGPTSLKRHHLANDFDDVDCLPNAVDDLRVRHDDPPFSQCCSANTKRSFLCGSSLLQRLFDRSQALLYLFLCPLGVQKTDGIEFASNFMGAFAFMKFAALKAILFAYAFWVIPSEAFSALVYDWYAILRVPTTASQAEILSNYNQRRAFLTRLIERGQENERELKLLDEAYQVLSDPIKRADYNDLISGRAKPELRNRRF